MPAPPAAGWPVLFALYGISYGLTTGTARTFIADPVPQGLRGTACGGYHALLGVIDLPASLLAGALWQGVGAWPGFGPSAPFAFAAATSLLETLLLLWRVPEPAAAP